MMPNMPEWVIPVINGSDMIGSLACITSPPLTVAGNIALDKVLVQAVGAGTVPEHLRLYNCTGEAVVLGISQNPADTVHLDATRKDKIPVLKRFSGGGTVLAGNGSLMYSVVLKTGTCLPRHMVRQAYEYVFSPLIAAFADRGIPVEFHPPSDLAVHTRKIAGNAQAQKRNTVLMHGCLLVNEDLDRIERYLVHPPEEPSYRLGRPHSDFLCNLSAFELGHDQAADILHTAWADTAVSYPLETGMITEAIKTADTFLIE
jgi:lipoate-protein ligase A